MKATKITGAEIAPLKVAALPSRPTAPTAFGGKGYSASEMKAAFDRLPLYIIDRLNLLIDDIADGEFLDAVETGISTAHTLRDLLGDVKGGRMASYLNVLGSPLTEVIQSLRDDIATKETGDANLKALVQDIISEILKIYDDIYKANKKMDEIDTRLSLEIAEIKLTADEDREATEISIADLNTDIEEIRALIGDISDLLDEIHLYAERVAGGDEI